MATARAPRPTSEETRAHLIEVAAEALAVRGYHGASYGELVAASGLSKGAFYHHFPSKQDLAFAVYRAKQAAVKQASDAAVEGIESPLERLVTSLRVRARMFAEDRSLQCLPRLSTDLAKVPELASRVTAGHRLPIEWYREMLADARAAGEIRDDLDLDAVARVLFSALVGQNELSERETQSADHEARNEELIAVLLALLLPPKPRSAPRKRPRRTPRKSRKGGRA